MSSAAAKVHSVHVDQDTKQELLEKLGDLSHVEIAQNEVLLAIYERPEKSVGGIIIPGSARKEDRYQGKVGLVVKIGAACRFERTDEKTGVTYGLDIQLYDWVVVRPSDTWALDVNTNQKALKLEDFVPCRLTYDDMIRMRVSNPAVIW